MADLAQRQVHHRGVRSGRVELSVHITVDALDSTPLTRSHQSRPMCPLGGSLPLRASAQRKAQAGWLAESGRGRSGGLSTSVWIPFTRMLNYVHLRGHINVVVIGQ
jgi:hypothetical protein